MPTIDILGVGYKLKIRCQHPNHEELPKQKKGHCTRVVSLKVCDAISDRYGTVFPVGGVLCTTHYKEGNKSVERIDVNEEIVVADEEERIDVDYVTEEIVVAEDKTLAAVNTSMNIATCFETSPVKTLKIKKVNDLCKRSKQNYKMKYHKLKEKLKQSFAEAAAPGQEKDFLKEVLDDSDSSEDEIPSELENLMKKYQGCDDALGKLVILSLVDKRKYTHDYICQLFGCSRYLVKKAVALSETWHIPEKEKITRERLDVSKCEHFIQFVFSSGMIQDVAYGSRKFDSGDVQDIPRAILTCKYSHAIGTYLDICEKTDFKPVSEASLWRILRELKPSQQKSLSGLDDILSTGMNGFEVLLNYAKKSLPSLLKALENGN